MPASELVYTKRLPLAFDVARLRADLDAANSGWKQHFATEHYRGDWGVLPLVTADGVEEDFATALGADFKPTPYLDGCPYLRQVLNEFRCPLLRVRLHRLKAGTRIKPHIDYLFDTHLDFVRIHVPIVTNGSVDFILNGQRLDLQPGEAWFTEVAFPHHVANRSDRDRIHLILDCFANEWLEEKLGFSPRAMRVEHRSTYRRWDKKYRGVDKRRDFQRRAKKALKLLVSNPTEFARAVASQFVT